MDAVVPCGSVDGRAQGIRRLDLAACCCRRLASLGELSNRSEYGDNAGAQAPRDTRWRKAGGVVERQRPGSGEGEAERGHSEHEIELVAPTNEVIMAIPVTAIEDTLSQRRTALG